MLHLIKMWLEAPVEETDERGNKRRRGGRNLGRRSVGKRTSLIDADDLVICCRVGAEHALTAMRRMMSKLKLTVNENKTRVCKRPEEKFDFLGLHVRAMLLDEKEAGLSRHGSISETGAARLSRYQRRNWTRYPQAGPEDSGRKAQSNLDWLGQLFLSGSGQQSLQCVDLHARRRLRRWLCDRHAQARPAITGFRKRLFMSCMVWCSYHTVPQVFRGRARESFPRAGCGKSASPVR